MQFGDDRQDPRRGAAQLSRRAVMGSLLAVAGGTVLGLAPAVPVRAATETPSPPRLTDLGMELSATERAAGEALVTAYPSVDVHCHPGRFFLKDLPYETPTSRAFGPPFKAEVLADMTAGRVSAALFAGVSDMRLLELTPDGIHATRQFVPGEAWEDYQRQISVLKKLVGARLVRTGLTPADVERARAAHGTAAVFAIEGGDFIEDDLGRIHTAFADGVRAITIVHYHVNQIGDIQTVPPVHGGLTLFGKAVVREMNSAGIIVDLAHATFEVTRDAVEVSKAPVMLSHTNLLRPTVNHPRLISVEHAKLIASTGGIVGSVPSGIGQSTLAEYIDSILRLIDAVGIEHVAIGTDMDANYRPIMRNYRDWSVLPAALLARGVGREGTAKVMGGNFLRVFTAALAAR